MWDHITVVADPTQNTVRRSRGSDPNQILDYCTGTATVIVAFTVASGHGSVWKVSTGNVLWKFNVLIERIGFDSLHDLKH